jgi:hypothetical protein
MAEVPYELGATCRTRRTLSSEAAKATNCAEDAGTTLNRSKKARYKHLARFRSTLQPWVGDRDDQDESVLVPAANRA